MKKLLILGALLLVSSTAWAMAKNPGTQSPCINVKWTCSIGAYQTCAPLFRVFNPTGGPVDSMGNPTGNWTLDETNPAFIKCKADAETACDKKAGC